MSDVAPRAFPRFVADRRAVWLMLAATVMGYAVFMHLRLGEELYQWTKTLAPYSVRQYLDMSKRFALQYGHLAFLAGILYLSKYLLTDDRTPAWLDAFIRVARPHTLPIFVFHVPFLYFFAALWGHDPSNGMHQTALAFATITASMAVGQVFSGLAPIAYRATPLLAGPIDRLFPQQRAATRYHPERATGSFSNFLHLLQIAAMATVFIGHFTYSEFSTLDLPGMDAWRRWAVPFFFLVAGYMAMLSLDKRGESIGTVIAGRVTSLWILVVPMLLLTPILDHVGYSLSPWIYQANEKYVDVAAGTGGPVDVGGFLLTFLNSSLFLNEIIAYKLAGFGTLEGGVRAFTNDAFWFLCYLVPYVILLAIGVKTSGIRRVLWIAGLSVFFGPPIMLLAPLFFGGCLVYVLHREQGPLRGVQTA
ncbi:acyltransferase family protein [Hwanghaeella sp.]|uniref:acyltransferase family protein n=1 Tax=Hwanghaeella sp. TaxID=2605943 RepID=UPI003CCBCABB